MESAVQGDCAQTQVGQLELLTQERGTGTRQGFSVCVVEPSPANRELLEVKFCCIPSKARGPDLREKTEAQRG